MKIGILGAGESGVGAALLAKKKGLEVFVSDRGKIKSEYKLELENNKIPYEELQHTESKIFEATMVVKSPGIPDQVILIKELKKQGIPVISEIEFAAKYTNATIIGITGSNGKTTTTKLIYHLLHTAGYDVAIGGNIGKSFARILAEKDHAYYVLELSSFQLDGIQDFRPDVSVLLNITPDHLDRYDYKMENYIHSKFQIIQNQKGKDLFIYNGFDKNIKTYLQDKQLITSTQAVEAIFYKKNKLTVGNSAYDTKKCSLKGQHNMFNATCAIHAAKAVGVADEFIQQGLDTFINAPHRLEHVAEIDGIEYINDSKATNVDAVFYALSAMEKPVIWIVGGTDKGNDYNAIEDLVVEKVKAIVCLGVDNTPILEAFLGKIEIIEETKSCKDAVAVSRQYAEGGDVVLLSPACASFDLFKNYEDRGEQFKKWIIEN
ncbi:MAG TPA: UDP-N-acetylmuramoyl-L-alanine--D-glutamate ligase [Saprospiraceae bacterium]|nr:UDP-N-acetylmuramoyl-L-alanine--D-glutamate ligase [Saprospiraceae bacterium]